MGFWSKFTWRDFLKVLAGGGVGAALEYLRGVLTRGP